MNSEFLYAGQAFRSEYGRSFILIRKHSSAKRENTLRSDIPAGQ